MNKAMRCGLASVVMAWAFGWAAVGGAQSSKKALDATTLVALVAGDALPENIVAVLGTRGLNLTPTAEYNAQLSKAGASSEVLDAVAKAPIATTKEGEETASAPAGREHLALAGKLIRAREFEAAAKEVDEALRVGRRKADAGFVMGEFLRRQQEWATAAGVYEEVLKQEPDFPEVRTKLSFVLHRAGDQEESLRQAKAVLAETPNNAEAHKNAGLALQEMRKFDASEHEFREAL